MEQVMNDSKEAGNSIFAFFLLTFLLAVPFYVLNVLAYRNIVGKQEIAPLYIILFAITPIASASFLTFRRSGIGGLKGLLRRAFDYKRIGKRRWYLVVLLTGPVLCAVPCIVLLLFQIPLGPSLAPAVALPAAFLLFLLMAAGEEVGWMGYAFEPMQSRFGALRASLLLGTVWVLWHIPFFVYVMPDPVVFSTQIPILIANRVLMTWVFNNTQKSVFAVILFHAADNTALVTLPEVYAIKPWGAIIHCVTVVIAAIVVTLLWGHKTLARYRFGN